MDNTLPFEFVSLVSSLEDKFGFSRIEDSTSESFGDRVLLFKLGPYQVRVHSDRGIWSVEFSESTEPGKWYYTALVINAVDGVSGKDELSIDEQSRFWQSRWPDVRAFFERNAQVAHRELARLAREIAKRRNPSWYQK